MQTIKHRKQDKQQTMKKEGFVHTVILNWKDGDNLITWNESCADIVEVFGLPGDRFMTHPTFDHMEVGFKSIRDAELCKILLSERM